MVDVVFSASLMGMNRKKRTIGVTVLHAVDHLILLTDVTPARLEKLLERLRFEKMESLLS